MPRSQPATLTITERKRHHNPHQPVGRWIVVERRLALYMRDGFRCLWCDADLSTAEPFAVTLDHIRRRVDGGTNKNQNLFTACRTCNSKRCHQPNDVDIERLTKIRRWVRARRVNRLLQLTTPLARTFAYRYAFARAQYEARRRRETAEEGRHANV